MRTSKHESEPRRRGGSEEGSQPRPPTRPPSQLPSVRHQAGRLAWAERFKNCPPADASGELFRRTPLDPTSPLPPRAGLFLVCSVLARACFEENALRRHYKPPLLPPQRQTAPHVRNTEADHTLPHSLEPPLPTPRRSPGLPDRGPNAVYRVWGGAPQRLRGKRSAPSGKRKSSFARRLPLTAWPNFRWGPRSRSGGSAPSSRGVLTPQVR